jgi:hypothetical protein
MAIGRPVLQVVGIQVVGVGVARAEPEVDRATVKPWEPAMNRTAMSACALLCLSLPAFAAEPESLSATALKLQSISADLVCKGPTRDLQDLRGL